MRLRVRTGLLVFALLVVFLGRAASASPAADSAPTAGEVKAEFLHAWNGYTRYAWGHMGGTMFGDFVRYCRSDAGYAALADVRSKQNKDRMESFVFAATFKYYYLLSAPDAIDFDAVRFNTEAHPLRAT